jgi:hypothetical protein
LRPVSDCQWVLARGVPRPRLAAAGIGREVRLLVAAGLPAGTDQAPPTDASLGENLCDLDNFLGSDELEISGLAAERLPVSARQARSPENQPQRGAMWPERPVVPAPDAESTVAPVRGLP